MPPARRPGPGGPGEGEGEVDASGTGAGADEASGDGAEGDEVNGAGSRDSGRSGGGAAGASGDGGPGGGSPEVTGVGGPAGGAPGVKGGESPGGGSPGVGAGEGPAGGSSRVAGAGGTSGGSPGATGAGATSGEGSGARGGGAPVGGAPGAAVGTGTGARRMPGVRLVQRVSSTRTFAKVAPHLIPALDRAVHRLTRGKVLLSAQMLPGIVLTARGARSGLERRTPLACMPEAGAARVRGETGAGEAGGTRGTPDTGGTPDAEGVAGAPESGWILVGSNFGRTGHPAWTANLLAHPDAVISWKGEDIPVTARLLTGEERAAVWRTALAFWPPYATYQARVDREIRLFRIVRRQATGTPDAVDGPPPA